ncbi:tryptophan 2,3-dioxygenase [Aerophototrophica crusticola]|uniref:Tryptophan 2,3-dioxygenase n=1 Tax=Aerophototrophica crusticola TaxID=1709002 RepID=A0A858RAW0_9PROT|nr:tryptophan 2,3-dioxygenase [Rhodospirillaceae bacterium B3]
MSTETNRRRYAVDLEGEGVHERPDLSYGAYLGLDTLLASQHPRSDEHDELLFIVIHQASELWMKLSLHELRAAREQVRKDELGPAFKMIARVARIQAQLIQSWDVLSTLTPADYTRFRPYLGQSSGFQSWQYRLLEYVLGNKNAGMMAVHRGDPTAHAALEQALAEPSLYDEALRLLARRGFDIPADRLDRDWREPYRASPEVEAAWLAVYRDTAAHWDLYELAEKLVDLEQRFQTWRFSHMKTVERVIGFKQGTGGTGGVSYLSKALDLTFFPELFSLRTSL